MTFKKIYDLHKQVEIADTLELGNRRLSVASATEIERERRHFTTKIQRQLSTLKNQIKIFNYKAHRKNLREIIDIQLVMSHHKTKSFFSVFAQCFSQTICDIDLAYKNLSCFGPKKRLSAELDDDDQKQQSLRHQRHGSQGVRAAFGRYGNEIIKENKAKVKALCMELYGIQDVLEEIDIDTSNNSLNSDMSIVDKIVHCMKFIRIAKNAMLYEIEKTYYQQHGDEDEDMGSVKFHIETDKLNDIVIIIARKLSIDEHMIEDIDRTQEEQLPQLAQMRVRRVFEYILNCADFNKFFGAKPLSAMDVATAILKNVFGMNDLQNNDSYFI